MKKLILFTGVFLYVILILICFAGTAQQAGDPLVHVHTVKEFKGKTTVKDTIFRLDTTKMPAMMHSRFQQHGRDSSAMHNRPMNGNTRAWAGRGHKRGMNIDSIAINIHVAMH